MQCPGALPRHPDRAVRVDPRRRAARGQQVKAIYQFLFRHLADATSSHDCQKVREVVSVLEEERETWRQLCEAMPEPPVRNDGGPLGGREITARDCPAAPIFSPPRPRPSARNRRISFEA